MEKNNSNLTPKGYDSYLVAQDEKHQMNLLVKKTGNWKTFFFYFLLGLLAAYLLSSCATIKPLPEGVTEKCECHNH